MENAEADEPTVRNHPKSVGKMEKSEIPSERNHFEVFFLNYEKKTNRGYELF